MLDAKAAIEERIWNTSAAVALKAPAEKEAAALAAVRDAAERYRQGEITLLMSSRLSAIAIGAISPHSTSDLEYAVYLVRLYTQLEVGIITAEEAVAMRAKYDEFRSSQSSIPAGMRPVATAPIPTTSCHYRPDGAGGMFADCGPVTTP